MWNNNIPTLHISKTYVQPQLSSSISSEYYQTSLKKAKALRILALNMSPHIKGKDIWSSVFFRIKDTSFKHRLSSWVQANWGSPGSEPLVSAK